MMKLIYKPVSILVSVLGGIVAGAVVKAALHRGAAHATRKLTGVWPGEDSGPGKPNQGA